MKALHWSTGDKRKGRLEGQLKSQLGGKEEGKPLGNA